MGGNSKFWVKSSDHPVMLGCCLVLTRQHKSLCKVLGSGVPCPDCQMENLRISFILLYFSLSRCKAPMCEEVVGRGLECPNTSTWQRMTALCLERLPVLSYVVIGCHSLSRQQLSRDWQSVLGRRWLSSTWSESDSCQRSSSWNSAGDCEQPDYLTIFNIHPMP